MTRSLIILPFGFPWDWPADCEQQTARILSHTSTTVAFLINEGYTVRSWLSAPKKSMLQKVSRSLYVFRPLFPIPFHRIPFIKKLNTIIAVAELRWLIRRLPHTTLLFWTFSMQHQVFPDMFPKRFMKIYDCVDDVASDVSPLDRAWKSAERRIVRHSDICFANSGTLYDKLKRVHDRVYKVPVGFHEEAFPSQGKRVPGKIKHIPEPRIIYSGTINSRIDFRLVYETAKQTPTYSYVFIGHVDHKFRANTGLSLTRGLERLSQLPNVYFLSSVPKHHIAQYVGAAKVGIIPYTLQSAFNRHCFPVKALEYLALGKPIVATRITELVPLDPLITTIQTARQFISALRVAMHTSGSKHDIAQRQAYAHNQSFHKKIHTIRHTLYDLYHIKA